MSEESTGEGTDSGFRIAESGSEAPLDRRMLQASVVLSGAVLMSLEILGSRVLAPSFGSSVFVWGSLITTFLAALAVGYAVGGRIVDRHPSLSLLSAILSRAAVLVVPSVVWAPWLLPRLAEASRDPRWSSLAAALVLFLPPSLAMGMVSPFAVRIGIRRMERAGSVAGGYSALSTAGSIAGTLLTAFVLIPGFAVSHLLIGLAAALVVAACLLIRDGRSLAIAAAAALTCTLAGAFVRVPPGIAGEKVLLRKDTAYHHITVTQLDTTRWLRFDNLTQSGVNLARPERPVASEIEAFFLALAFRPGIRRICMIGLGGGIFPRLLSQRDPAAIIDTVEIDPVVRDVARQYFLYEESERVRTVIQDGRTFLTPPGPLYDLIVLDAFNATGIPFHLTTREFYEAARRRLSADGVFAANFARRLMGRDQRLFWASYQTVRRQFGQVYVINAGLSSGGAPSEHTFLFATVSADPVPLETVVRHAGELSARWKLTFLPGLAAALIRGPEPPPGTKELTDAYAPVEALQHF